jgi:hypothetical protein
MADADLSLDRDVVTTGWITRTETSTPSGARFSFGKSLG